VDTGFKYDRVFMLLELEGEELKNMHVPLYPQMALFKTQIIEDEGKADGGSIIVTYSGPNDVLPEQRLEVPLIPDTTNLDRIDVNMHSSPVKGYTMGAEYNDWFTAQFGFPVILAYIGPERRSVLGNLLPTPAAAASTIRSASRFLSSYLPTAIVGKQEGPSGITFADCAHFLVCTTESLKDTSARLPGGVEMDIKKFRPNIVVSGAPKAWAEDLWGEIVVKTQDGAQVDIPLTGNCVRCVSINVDYNTGKPGLGEDGQMLKKLMSDRRIDKGAKYKPVFGRYGFLASTESLGKSIAVGDGVDVVKTLEETTTFGRLTPPLFLCTSTNFCCRLAGSRQLNSINCFC
jgi:uncharacterized protein YcbX